MSNLYSMTKNQAAIRDLIKVGRDTAGNLTPKFLSAFANTRWGAI